MGYNFDILQTCVCQILNKLLRLCPMASIPVPLLSDFQLQSLEVLSIDQWIDLRWERNARDHTGWGPRGNSVQLPNKRGGILWSMVDITN